MQKNSDSFSMQDAMALANTPAGKQLIALLQSADPEMLRKAMASATSGDMQGAKDSLTPLLNSADVKKLMQQLGGQHG